MKIDWLSWERDPIFKLIKETGKIDEQEMRKVFNLGIGLVIIINKFDVSEVTSYLKLIKEKHFIIGEII